MLDITLFKIRLALWALLVVNLRSTLIEFAVRGLTPSTLLSVLAFVSLGFAVITFENMLRENDGMELDNRKNDLLIFIMTSCLLGMSGSYLR